MKKLYTIGVALALASVPLFASASSTLCYGTLDGVCKAADISVQPAAVIELPAGFTATADTRPVGLRIVLKRGTFAGVPVVTGATVAASLPDTLVVTGGPNITVAGLSVSGADLKPGDEVRAQVTLFDPNFGSALIERSVVLARIKGVTDIEVLTFNPAGNSTQQSFLRIANVSDVQASVTLSGTDDVGVSAGPITFTLPPAQSIQVSSEDLEHGNGIKGLHGAFGDGIGKWRVHIVSDADVRVQSLVRNATDGTLSDVSSVVR